MMTQFPIGNLKFVALDLETTGFYKSSKIVEVGLARFDLDGTDGQLYEQLVNPARPIPWDAKRVHGIGDADVLNSPRIEEVLPTVKRLVEGRVVVIHNALYDTRYLDGVEIPYLIDTLPLARRIWPELKSHSLRALQSEPRPWHRAGPDAQATAILFGMLVNELADRLGREPLLHEVIG
jgi:DNA polymerase III epsilon subunit-like protein